jgi:HlyD family secretion protein
VALAVVLMGSLRSKDRNLPHVTTAKVEKVDLVSKVTANGKIQARRKVDLSALVMGQIVNLAVKEGDRVQKAQLLLQIDKAQLAAAAAGSEASLAAMRNDLQAARSTAEQARIDYERARRNFDAKILAEADLQKAKSVLDTAKANLAATEERMRQASATLAGSRDSLSKTTVTAPINGVVTALPIKEGEVTVIGTMNNPGTQLLTISDMSEVEAVMMVDETSTPQVKVGQSATLSVDAYPGKKFKGTVTEVGSSPIPKNDPDLLTLTANSEAINFKVKIRVDDPPDTVRPGFSVTAEIVTGRNDGATAIPIQSLVVRDVPKKDAKKSAGGRPETEEGVYLVGKEGKLEFQKVETGLAGELMIEVKKGPAVGQEIVTGPFKVLRQVKEGDKVVVENEKVPGDGKGAKTS